MLSKNMEKALAVVRRRGTSSRNAEQEEIRSYILTNAENLRAVLAELSNNDHVTLNLAGDWSGVYDVICEAIGES